MTSPLRLGAVSYLNVRPLVYGLDAHPDVSVRFDVPSECARLLARGEIDLGMVPSITYLERPGDRIVPGICIGSNGPVASVALFTRTPIARVQTIALDTSSRTSATLVQILCRRVFDIAPVFVPREPDLPSMLAVADAALVIGDAALFADAKALGVDKLDLGALWHELTGLPFVWAFWSGPPDAVDRVGTSLLQNAAESGIAHFDEIAANYCAGHPGQIDVARRYLHENLTFDLSARAVHGLERYYREAAELGLVPAVAEPAFFGAGPA
ncbi:MAG: menaquinone biosynthesis protein [Vicinamibacterales bacterium]